MSLIPFSRDELKDWGVKAKDVETIYFTTYIIILSGLLLMIFIYITSFFV